MKFNKKLQLQLKVLYEPLKDLLLWFKEYDIPSIIIGGVAVSLLSEPRATRDIDALVLLEPEKWQEFLDLGAKFGYYSRKKDTLEFAQENRILLVKHQPTQTEVDISFGALPFEKEAIKHALKIKIENIFISVPIPEDLIIMKAVAHRPQDLEDIRNVLDVNPDLDFKRIKYWVKEFAKVLEMPEIFDDLKSILSSRTREK